MDFQNDGEFVGGCIAGGRNYFHINSAGDAEPCVFIHYSNANIHDQSILEILHSPLFMLTTTASLSTRITCVPARCWRTPSCCRRWCTRPVPTAPTCSRRRAWSDLCEKCKNYAANWQPTADEIWSHTKIRESRYENYKDWKPSQPIEK